MQRIANFEKVSYKQFEEDMKGVCDQLHLTKDKLKEIYKKIELPTRATEGSAGYDFKLPFDLTMQPNLPYLIPTGVRCKMFNWWMLNIYPRSSLGFKYRFQLENTVGIIDSDYYNSDNEGHIMLKVRHNNDMPIKLNSGQGIAQGIFTEFGITMTDSIYTTRNGGFGSTDKSAK